MDQRPNCKNYKTLVRKHRHQSWWPWIRQWLFRCDVNRKSNNNKKEKLDFTNSKNKNFLLWRTSLRAKATLRKKNEGGRIRFPDYSLYYKGSVIKTVWYWHKKRSIDQWNWIQSPEINLSARLWHLIYVKGGKNIKRRKYHFFNKWCWENWRATRKRTLLHEHLQEHFPTLHTKTNSKWIKDLNVRPDTIKLLEENIGRTLSDVIWSTIFFDPPLRVMKIKTKINKWNLIKLKRLCTAKETVKTTKRQPQRMGGNFCEWSGQEGILQNKQTAHLAQ